MGRWWRWALISLDGVAPSWMVSVSASVNLPLHHKVQKFSCGTGSPGWSRKRAIKWLWWFVIDIDSGGDGASRLDLLCLCFTSTSRWYCCWLPVSSQGWNLLYTSLSVRRLSATVSMVRVQYSLFSFFLTVTVSFPSRSSMPRYSRLVVRKSIRPVKN